MTPEQKIAEFISKLSDELTRRGFEFADARLFICNAVPSITEYYLKGQ